MTPEWWITVWKLRTYSEAMKKSWESAMSLFHSKRAHGCPRMTFCYILHYKIMNQIYTSSAEKNYICAKMKIKGHLIWHWNQNYSICTWVTYLWKEIFNNFQTSFIRVLQLMQNISYDNFWWRWCIKMHFLKLFSHPCTTKPARQKPLIFWKNIILYEVYKLANFHWNLRMGCGVWGYRTECLHLKHFISHNLKKFTNHSSEITDLEDISIAILGGRDETHETEFYILYFHQSRTHNKQWMSESSESCSWETTIPASYLDRYRVDFQHEHCWSWGFL
jgi:hypothetical protein